MQRNKSKVATIRLFPIRVAQHGQTGLLHGLGCGLAGEVAGQAGFTINLNSEFTGN